MKLEALSSYLITTSGRQCESRECMCDRNSPPYVAEWKCGNRQVCDTSRGSVAQQIARHEVLFTSPDASLPFSQQKN